MNRKISVKIQQRIINLLKETPGVPVNRKQMSHTLKIGKHEYKIFMNSLVALAKSGKITHVRKFMYAWPQKNEQMIGELRTTRAGYGFVIIEGREVDVFVAQPNLNTAFDRDIVEIQLYASSRGRRLEGFVTKVVERFRKQIVGTYHLTEYYSYVVPDDPKIYRDIIVRKDDNLQAKDGQKVLVSFERWERDQHNPEGAIIEVLGNPGDKGVDIASVAYSYNLAMKFSDKLEKEAQKIQLEATAKIAKDREDLRDLVCFTIDPVDARDFDDAVSLTTLKNGNRELGVHIADVSHFVRDGSELDKEAYKRSVSVYLVDQVIPMLPEHLSNNLCSLKPDEDRLAFSCFMEFNPDLEIVNYRIKPSVIRSKRRFNYQEVQDILDGIVDDALLPVLKEMDALRAQLMKKRFENGGIDFDTPEVRFVLDEKGHPVEIVPKPRLNAHRLVEEFMLMANQTTARHIRNISKDKKNLLPFLYRIHETPDEKKMDNFYNFLSALEVPFKPVKKMTSKYFQSILESIKGSKEEQIIEEVALRSMMRAVYSEKNVGHFGLGFRDYSHFTSPIRRYPDLVVHRLLKMYAKDEMTPPKDLRNKLKKIAAQTTKMERLAVEAERESIKLKQAEYISRYVGETFTGIVSGVTAFGVFVELKDIIVEGLIRIADLTDDFYIYDEAAYSLIGRDTEQSIRLADEVEVRVEAVDMEKKQAEFSLLRNFSDEPLRQTKTKRKPRRKKR